MVYVFQMFFSWDRRSQGTFPAVLLGMYLTPLLSFDHTERKRNDRAWTQTDANERAGSDVSEVVFCHSIAVPNAVFL